MGRLEVFDLKHRLLLAEEVPGWFVRRNGWVSCTSWEVWGVGTLPQCTVGLGTL